MTSPKAKIFREAGFVTASEAANAIGVSNVGTVHRMAKQGKIRFRLAGRHWYISVASLLNFYSETPEILVRIKALGVEPKQEVTNGKPEKARGQSRAYQAKVG